MGGEVMDMGIRGRCALVNGASAGMGRAAAESLAGEGVDLVLSARGEVRLEEAASDLRARYGVKVTAVAADHSTAEGRQRILEACPSPDILVATCSPPPMTPDHRAITPEQWQASIDTGLMSPVHFIEAVLPGMFHTAAVHDQFTATAQRNGTSYDIEVARFVEAYQIPARRFGDPRDIGALVTLLCSEHAGYITGQSIVVDGGATRSTF